MRKSILFLTSLFVLIVSSCKDEINSKEYLQKVLNNLERIESATYYLKSEGWAPGDTSAYSINYTYIKEYNNPSDSTIGASYVQLLQEDTSRLLFCYNGIMRAVVYEENKTIVIDSFKIRKLPFRPLNAPFFNYAKNILQYALETNDSISIKTEERNDTLHMTLTIFEDKQVEFHGKAYYFDNSQYVYGETTSKYELWINKSIDLPFRVRREMSHDISVQTCRNFELNKIKIEDFNASDYFQPEYTIAAYGNAGKITNKDDLIGKNASDWVLRDSNNNTFAFKELKSNVLMIQFTSVTCGPCRASIPFLNKLSSEFDKQIFDFVAIEAFTQNSNVLKHYQEKNGISYKFLMSTKEVTENYQIKSIPVFFLLDKNRVIRKIIRGYGVESTDKEIREAIKKML